MRSRGKANFLKKKGNKRIMAGNVCETSHQDKCALCRIPVAHVRTVYNTSIDIHETKEEPLDWLVRGVRGSSDLI